MFCLLIFIAIGIIIGSFLNVCISRIPRKESIIFPNSHCPICGTNIKPYDNIPILSYIILGAKCRSCKGRISLQYPLVELLTGIIFLLLYMKFDISIVFLKYAVLACLLLVIGIIDFKTQEIPDGLNLFGLIAGMIFAFTAGYKEFLITGLTGFLLGGGLFLLIAIVSKGSMGGGDIKLMAVLGIWLGWKHILLVSLLSFIIGSVISIILMILKIKSRKDYIPFGPFIALAAFTIILYGNDILNWYVNSMLR
ncbi:MAG: prepilin peptidase [Bacillota bacterium]